MKIKINLTINKKINDEYREKFIRKKGDLSKQIEEMMIKKINEN